MKTNEPSREIGWENEPEVKVWIEQGRDPEHIYAVKNFLTGQGAVMIKRLLAAAELTIAAGKVEKKDVEDKLTEEEQKLMDKIFGKPYKTPEYMIERRTGFNAAITEQENKIKNFLASIEGENIKEKLLSQADNKELIERYTNLLK